MIASPCNGRLARKTRYPRLDEIYNLALQVDPVETIDLLHSGRTGHVHLGQKFADDIQPDEVKPVFFEPRLQHPADFPIARGDRRLDASAADMDIAAMLILARHPQHAS